MALFHIICNCVWEWTGFRDRGNARRSAFFQAIWEGDWDMVVSMLNTGFDVNAVDEKGRPAIVCAVLSQNMRIIAEFLKRSPCMSMEPGKKPRERGLARAAVFVLLAQSIAILGTKYTTGLLAECLRHVFGFGPCQISFQMSLWAFLDGLEPRDHVLRGFLTSLLLLLLLAIEEITRFGFLHRIFTVDSGFPSVKTVLKVILYDQLIHPSINFACDSMMLLRPSQRSRVHSHSGLKVLEAILSLTPPSDEIMCMFLRRGLRRWSLKELSENACRVWVWAASNGCKRTLAKMQSEGLDINYRTIEGTAVEIASRKRNGSLVSLLIEQGANWGADLADREVAPGAANTLAFIVT